MDADNIEQEAAEPGVVLRISSKDDPTYTKRVAGAISWQLREKGFCKARAVKMDAVNTAVKAIAVVNQYVSGAEVIFSFDPVFATMGEGDSTTAVAFHVQEAPDKRPETFVEYKVSGRRDDDPSLSTKLAGAIATPVRAGKGVTLRCIGPASVYRAVIASTLAKGYVWSNGISSAIVPYWSSLQAEGAEPVSLIQIDFWGIPAGS